MGEKENTSKAPIIYLQSTKHLENRMHRNNILQTSANKTH
jgi:hypothetical protein